MKKTQNLWDGPSDVDLICDAVLVSRLAGLVK
jgi:hypothetical protein